MKILQLFAPTALFKLHTETYPPPLVLGFLEKILEKKGHTVVSIDANNYSLFKLNKENISEEIMDELLKDFHRIKPDILLISTWTYGLPFVIELVKRVNVKTVLGGYNATFLPKETLKQTGVDCVFSGNNLFEFADSLEKNGIIREKTKMNINELPLVDFSSFIFKEKPKKFYLMSSFGCKFNCSFCSDRIIWDGYHSFNAERMIEQIKMLRKKYSPTYFAFWESNISMNRDYGNDFLKMYDGKTQWFTYSRVDTLSDKLIEKMAQKSCRYVFLGVEHIDDQILQYYNKTNDPEKYVRKTKEVIKLLLKNNIQPVVSIIVGSPKETKDSLSKLYDFIEKIKKQGAQIELSPLTMEIGTKLWNEYKEGRIKLFKTSNHTMTHEYCGLQPFSDKYEDVMLTPQKFLFNKQLEKSLAEFIRKVNKL